MMALRCSLRGLAALGLSLALGGCQAANPTAKPAVKYPGKSEAPASVANAPPGPQFEADPSAEKVASAHAHYAAGVIHEMNDEAEAALEEYYRSALDDPSNEELILEVTRRFLQNKQPEKALQLLTRAAARPKASGAIYARLGLVYSQLGKFEPAVEADRTAIKRAPDSFSGYQNLFLAYLQNKQEQEALKVLDEAAKQRGTDAEFLLSLGELYGNFLLQAPSLKQKITTSALGVLRRADKLDPSNASQRLRLADAYSSFGENVRAAELYLDLLKKLPNLPLLRERVRAKLAGIYLRGNEGKKASEQLEGILRDDPTNAMAHYYLGRILYEEKKAAEAVDYLKKAVLLSPDFEEAWFYLAVSQLALNQTDDALATLDKAREKFPGNFDLELWTGLAYAQQKAYAQALRHYTKAELIARASDPSRLNYEFYFQLGAASERSGDLEQAADYFQKCLDLKPDWPEALNYLGYMWAEHGQKLNEARQMLEKAVRAEPRNGAYLDSLGWVMFKLNQPNEALKHVLKAVELGTEPDPTEYDHLGDIYQVLKQPSKAREAWTKSLSLEPNEQVRKKLESLPK